MIIKVSSKTSPNKLASALFKALNEAEGKGVLAQAVGAAAVNQLVKGVAIARGIAAPKGFDIVIIPSFTEVDTDKGTISGMRMRIMPFVS